MTHQHASNQALSEASKQLEKHLDQDSHYLDLSRLLNISSGSYTAGISGIGENDYASISALPGLQNVPNFANVRRVPLPVELVEQFNHLQYNCLMGLFPEIKRAWLSIDSDIFVWNYEDGSDVAYFDGLSEYIMCVGLVRPKPGIFQDHIKFLLCLATAVDVVLLGVSFSEATQTAGYPYKEMHLQPEPLFVLPLDQQIEITSISGTRNGRIFMTTKNCCLFEIEYRDKAGWFTQQCRIVNHSSSYLYGVSGIYNIFMKVVNLFSTEDSMQQIAIDESRNILYTLSKESTIQVYDLGSNGNLTSHVVTLNRGAILSQASRSARYIDAGNFAPVVYIAPISKQESLGVQLIAVTKSGVRLYFVVTSSFSDRPSHIQLVHIRMPPGCTPSVPAIQRPNNINISYYNHGLMLMASSSSDDSDILWLTNPDVFPFMKLLKESQCTTAINGHIWAINETKDFDQVANPNLKTVKSDPPAIVSQHAKPLRQFVILGAQGAYLLDSFRPSELLRCILLKCGRVDQEAVQTYFSMDTINAVVSCLVLACSNRPSDQHVTKLAAQAFFCYSDEPRFEFPTSSNITQPGVGSHPGDTKPQPFQQPPSTNVNQAPSPPESGRPLSTENTLQSAPTDGVPVMKFSLKHDGVYLYLSRILRPVWNTNLTAEVVRTSTKVEYVTMESQFSSEELLWLCEQVASLKAFIEEHNQLFLSPSLHHHMLNVVKSQAGVRSDPNVPNRQVIQSQLQQRYKADAVSTEKRSFENMSSLLTGCIECFSLWSIICNHDFSVVMTNLSKEMKDIILRTKFKDLVLGDGKITNALIAALIDMYLLDNASTDPITDQLRIKCPSLYSSDDATCSKAYEMLHQAKISTDMKEAELAYRSSLQLFRQVTKHVDVAQVCQQYKNVFFFEGVIELALTAAEAEDVKEYALNFYKNGDPPNDNIGREAFTKRSHYYKCIVDSLDYLMNAAVSDASRSPLGSVSSKRANTNLNTLTVNEAETMMEKVLSDSFASGDELIHVTLYDWLIANNLHDRLLEVSSVYLEAYLKRATTSQPSNLVAMDLLWKYYEKNNKYQSASLILSKLAERTSTDITLQKRVEYLSRAIISAKSASFPGASGSAGDFLHELEEKLEVARIQSKIHDALVLLQQEKGHLQEYTEALRELNGGIFDISTLYKDFASRFDLAECKLAILYTAGHNDVNLVETVWKDIIDYEIHRSKMLSEGAKMSSISNRLAEIGNLYAHSEQYFPLLYILTLLEKRSCELNWDPRLAYETMLRIDISRKTMLTAYNLLFRAKDPFWQAVKKPLHLFLVIHNLITSSIEAKDLVPDDKREFCISALSSVDSYLVELESMSLSSIAVQNMISRYRSLKAQLSRLT
ncbi:uncharacterized protein TRIADDRAFT_29198 [Trichoplax adhaerens]|uniref:Nucleoporin Nup133/Nup155-like N-terminal domain-containing protein n=1 Tax=Trichoplax adhaerens TaxID=10228 RepID=B3S4Y7_TRIAD|nr:hypothetical protein TRIADDRAFT_29198 [Trichoplax adhaerens]EDV22293.1 hypothetical protein TRIADDRAFT_29198 [Trichoplax adhaerens]|eukprot:XP_002115448.1 hypothetical protein TRIADDRAFT_29198 [Trichoplax adhaerens]